MLTIKDGWLEGIPRKESPDHGGTIDPVLIVIHYTGAGSDLGSVEWLSRKDEIFVSAHVVIGRSGEITQLVPFIKKAFHAGVSSWWGCTGVNGFSVGLELANYGLLRRICSGATYQYYSRTLTPVQVPAESIAMAPHRNTPNTMDAWEKFPVIQLETARRVCAALVAAYGIGEIVGHDDVAPGRKIDPGPAFPMEDFRKSVFVAEAV